MGVPLAWNLCVLPGPAVDCKLSVSPPSTIGPPQKDHHGFRTTELCPFCVTTSLWPATGFITCLLNFSSCRGTASHPKVIISESHRGESPWLLDVVGYWAPLNPQCDWVSLIECMASWGTKEENSSEEVDPWLQWWCRSTQPCNQHQIRVGSCCCFSTPEPMAHGKWQTQRNRLVT